MTVESPRSSSSSTDDPARLERRFAGVIARARGVGVVEAAWRLVAPLVWVALLWVALSWLGVWGAVPPALRLVLLGAFAVLFAVAVAAIVRGRGRLSEAAARAAAIRRVETASGLTGHELAGLDDRLATASDPTTTILWTVHRERLAARIGRLSSGLPHPDLGRADRFALRPLVGLLLFIGWFAAPGEHWSRLGAAFSREVATTTEDRIDAWIDPPAYTGLPPQVLLAEGRPSGTAAAGGVSVPQGSRLVVRVARGGAEGEPRPVDLTLVGADGKPIAVTAAEPAPAAAGEGAARSTTPIERAATLTRDVEARLGRNGEAIAAWRITVRPDRPPTIRLIEPPETQFSGAMAIQHETDDDWGVVSAEARFAATGPAGGPHARPLYGPPSFPLSLPIGRAHTGKGKTIRDVTAHPFAGATMRMTLVARDEAGQEGASEPVEVVLPERRFRKPLARALVELRRRLALDAGAAPVVVTALDALALSPERFGERPGTHLGMRFLLRRAAAARSDDDLREVVDLLWVAATTIDDGDLSTQEKALRDAQEALRQALANGASPQEIERLTRELRKAMENWLAAKAEQARRNPQASRERGGPQRTITDRDIQRMLDRIEALAKTGSREAAEELLRQLREMTENLEAGAPSGSAEDQAAGEALEKLGDMIRRQQKLMDDTHRSMRSEDGGETGNPSDMGRLGEGQSDLRESLKNFSQGMKGAARSAPGGETGRGENGRGETGRGGSGGDDGSGDFDEADRAMGEAGEALGQGDGDRALDAQGRALEALRRGARKVADQMMRGRGGRDGEASGEEDPLGRPHRARGPADSGKVKVPEEIDVERARRILDDIRRRLGEPSRPRFERDYLDRLQKLD